ncbi:LysE family translocator [Bacillus sp. B1-b2]|uniref:LysE family translocator n=1 Tax=Bacillus sp. B1-b2 TaxID=2653201 RepID=UPI0012621A0F|nr:LysE family transporter [Bacillus sp. B1-b2]KAB7665642.1 LysE family translocator [Bacillus sp. B1-b2]
MSITSFVIYCIIVTFSPGPTNIVILSTVHNYGTKKALRYTYGATIAFGVLLAISALLNTLLITFIPRIILAIQIIGSLYMLYLAYQIYKMDTTKASSNNTATFKSGFLMQFLNPKVILFTMTVIPSYILPNYMEKYAVSMSVIGITFIGFLAFTTWIVFGKVFKRFLQSHSKLVNVTLALFLVYSATMVWF